MAASCIDVTELPDFDETTGVLAKEDDSDEEIEIELREEDPPFLRGHGRQSVELSPVRIVKVSVKMSECLNHVIRGMLHSSSFRFTEV